MEKTELIKKLREARELIPWALEGEQYSKAMRAINILNQVIIDLEKQSIPSLDKLFNFE